MAYKTEKQWKSLFYVVKDGEKPLPNGRYSHKQVLLSPPAGMSSAQIRSMVDELYPYIPMPETWDNGIFDEYFERHSQRQQMFTRLTQVNSIRRKLSTVERSMNANS